jgi:DNA-directed RNA polymerase subunit RPC12/RpoP
VKKEDDMYGWKEVLASLPQSGRETTAVDLAGRMGLLGSDRKKNLGKLSNLRRILLRCSVFGTVERWREKIKKADRIRCPKCRRIRVLKGRGQYLYSLNSYGKRRVANKFKPLKRD